MEIEGEREGWGTVLQVANRTLRRRQGCHQSVVLPHNKQCARNMQTQGLRDYIMMLPHKLALRTATGT